MMNSMPQTVGDGNCHSCESHSPLFVTTDGLRCEDCRSREKSSTFQKPTYAPSAREPWSEEFASEREKAEASLPDNHETVRMNDGSVFSLDAVQFHALNLSGEDTDKLLSSIADETEQYFEREKEPGIRYESVVPGGSIHKDSTDSYENHAELAPLVMFKFLNREIQRVVFMCLSDAHTVSQNSVSNITTAESSHSDTRRIHRKLLSFAADSRKEFTIYNQSVIVYHTHFGTYNTEDALKTLVDRTEKWPSKDRGFKDKAKEAIKHSNAHVDRDTREFYKPREYLDKWDLLDAASTYYTEIEGEETVVDTSTPQRKTRAQEIADILTLCNVFTAEESWTVDFSLSDVSSCPNEEADSKLLMGSLMGARDRLHQKNLFSRPDPSLHTVRVLTTLYEESGYSATVRDLYGILVSDMSAQLHDPNAADTQELMFGISRFASSAAGVPTPHETGKWTSENEPPIESLSSHTTD